AQAKGEASPQVRGADGPAGEVTRREPKGPKNKPGQRQAPSVAEETLASLEQRKKTQESHAQLRRQRSRSLFLRLALFVLLPTLLMTGYAGFIASDSYESVAMFSIQSADNSPSLAMEGLIGLAGANPSSRDTLAAREYVLSREMLAV